MKMERIVQAVRPALERMEGRELLSGLTVALQGGPAAPQLTPALLEARAAARASNGSANGFVNGQTPLLGNGQPTPRERARETFTAYFSGPVTVGPGRFSDQAKVLYFRGLGGSNQFLHGDFQMGIVYPTDPSAPLTGEAVLEDKNSNSSGIIGLQLTGITPQTFDRLGRPTHLTFVQDPNVYSGIYFVDASTGTVDIHYSKGSATATFHGLVYTSGLTSPLKNGDLYSHGGRNKART